MSLKTVVMTGASTGIGRATTKFFLIKDSKFLGSVRRLSDGDRLSTTFGRDFILLLKDVTDATAVHRAAAQVGENLGRQNLAGLVNNA